MGIGILKKSCRFISLLFMTNPNVEMNHTDFFYGNWFFKKIM